MITVTHTIWAPSSEPEWIRDVTLNSSQVHDEGYNDMYIGFSPSSMLDEYYGINRLLINFDLTQIPSDATIVSAKIRLYCFEADSGTDTFRAYRMLKSWDDNANWFYKDQYNTQWQTSGAGGANDRETTDIGSLTTSGTGWHEIIFTASDVQDMIDGTIDPNGFLIKCDDESTATLRKFVSRNSGWDAHRPELVLTYTTAELRVGNSSNRYGWVAYDELADAISDLPDPFDDNYTIKLYNGEWSDTPAATAPFDLSHDTNGYSMVIEGVSGESPVIKADSNGSNERTDSLVRIENNTFSISGIEFNGDSYYDFALLRIDGTYDSGTISVNNCTFKWDSHIDNNAAYGIFIWNTLADSIDVENCSFIAQETGSPTDTSYKLIAYAIGYEWVFNSVDFDTANVIGCSFDGGWGSWLQFFNKSSFGGENIQNNTFIASEGRVDKGIISGNQSASHVMDISNNIFKCRTTATGALVWYDNGGGFGSIVGLLDFNNNTVDMYDKSYDGYAIYMNGIAATSLEYLTAYNNIFYNVKNGIYLNYNAGVGTEGIDYNCFYEYTNDYLVDASAGGHEVYANPDFINETTYILNIGSPCIDAGNPASDNSNEPTPNGGAINIGNWGNTENATSDYIFHVSGFSGSPGNTGGRTDPLSTIESALALCNGSDTCKIKVATGNYSEKNLSFVSEVTLSGGYSDDGEWTENPYKYTTKMNPGRDSINDQFFSFSGKQNFIVEGFIFESTGIRFNRFAYMNVSSGIGTSYIRNNRFNYFATLFSIANTSPADKIVFENNIIQNLSGSLISTVPSGYDVITDYFNNTFYNIDGYCCVVSNSSCKVRNNIFQDVWTCIYGNGTTGHSDYNCFYDYSTLINNAGSAGANDIVGSDPQLQDPSSDLFNILSSSPCKNTCDPTYMPTNDIKGIARVTNDMGAIAYLPFSSGFTTTEPTNGEPVQTASWEYSNGEYRFYINGLMIGYMDNTGVHDVSN